ncbi:MAG TPA: hypothetical protein VFG09_05800 [Thermodesulfovibrionales bacterium]|nr:hypothetical protein [Thermodesulfovibrionales bacterium]
MVMLSTNIRRKAWLLFLSFPLVLIGCGRQNDENLYNVQGTWNFYHTTKGMTGLQGPEPALFSFSQSKEDITGTAPDGSSLSGSTSDVNISFSLTEKDGTVFNYTGTILVIATMSGTWTSSNGYSGTWQAIVNTPALVNVAGNWNITTSGIPGTSLFELKQNTGSSSLDQSIFAGTVGTGLVSSGTVLFTWVGDDGTTYFYTGTESGGNAMSGTWLTDKGQTGTWSGTKII